MNTKHLAVFFVALLSLEYVSATFFGGYRGVPKAYDGGKGYYGWSSGCRCKRGLTSRLDGILEGIQGKLGRYSKGFAIRDHSLEEYEFRNGRITGLERFDRPGSYQCSLSRDYVRVYFYIRFVRLVIRYYVSLVEDILSGFFGGIGSFIGRLLGKVSNSLCLMGLSDVFATVVLNQRFGSGRGFELEGFYFNKLGGGISFLDKLFSRHQDQLSSFLRPVCDHVLHNVFQNKLGGIFGSQFGGFTAERNHFYYESNSEEKSYRSYDEEGEGEEEEETDD